MTSMASPEPTVTIQGRKVTVTFEMPFMVGDKCFTPYHYAETAVSILPEVQVRLWDNLQKVSVHHEGSWYTANHTQVHGTKTFLPDKRAFLEWWIAREDRKLFEERLPGLRHFFRDDPVSLVRLSDRLIQMLNSELSATKNEIGRAVVDGSKRAIALESAIAKATGGTK